MLPMIRVQKLFFSFQILQIGMRIDAQLDLENFAQIAEKSTYLKLIFFSYFF